MKILVTGGAGFIGSNFIRYLLAQHPQDDVVNLDALTYAGNLENLADVADASALPLRARRHRRPRRWSMPSCAASTAVINFAAETHVDRSIDDAAAFLHTNVNGTVVLLDAARRHGVQRFLQVSTDEVYGSLGPTGHFTEASPLCPSSPYSASKAAADLLALSFWTTYRLPVMVTRCSNNFGPYQFPEKVIPLFVTNALEDQPLPLYGDGLERARLDPRRRPLRRARSGAAPRPAGRGVQHRRRQRADQPRAVGAHPARAGQAADADPLRHRSAGARPALRDRCEQDPARAGVAADVGRSRTGCGRRSPGTATIPSWWHHVKSGDYRDYYERLYGARLRAAGERTGVA